MGTFKGFLEKDLLNLQLKRFLLGNSHQVCETALQLSVLLPQGHECCDMALLYHILLKLGMFLTINECLAVDKLAL